MRVLHCIPGMGGGGAERQLAYLAGALRQRSWEVHVAIGADGPNRPRLEAGGAVVHRLSGANSYDPRLALQLLQIARRVQPDLVQAWFVQMEVLGGAVAGLCRIPWILSERSSILAYPRSVKNSLHLAIARSAAAIVSNSVGGHRFWDSRAAPGTLRAIIPNALPLDEIDRVPPAAPPIDRPGDLVLFVGRFGPEKNVDRLVTALREVTARPSTIAMLCGDGPLFAEIGGRIARDGTGDRILTPGYVASVWPLMKRADVLVSPSLFEGHPNAVLEGAACGCPLVVSDIAAHHEFLDDSMARFVDPCDAGALARTIMEVLDDKESARQRAAAARAMAGGLSIDAAADAYDRLYRDVLRSTRRP